jgi:ankyrin repeat protein
MNDESDIRGNALLYASFNGNLNMIEELIEVGADIYATA